MVLLYLLGIIISLYIDHCIAKEFANIAAMKGHHEKKYYWYTFIFTVIGMLMVIALPNFNKSGKVDITKPTNNNVSISGGQGSDGCCEMCHQEDQLFYCKIEDEMGIRYKYLCPECIEKTKALVLNKKEFKGSNK